MSDNIDRLSWSSDNGATRTPQEVPPEPHWSFQFSSGFAISEIVLNDDFFTVHPPFMFDIKSDPASQQYELTGRDELAHIYLAHSRMEELYKELCDEWLPFLWNDYALADDSELSAGAIRLKRALLQRIKGVDVRDI